MGQKEILDKKEKSELIAWSSFMASFLGQVVLTKATFFNQHNSGLEEYLPKDNLVGQILMCAGLAYVVAGHSTLIRLKKGKNLITKGLYEINRHPIYTGFLLGSIGIMMGNPSIESLVAGGLVFTTAEITTRMEEKKLLKLYGDDFKSYKNKVSKWIPYLNHLKKGLKI